jgi:hypothetical protein
MPTQGKCACPHSPYHRHCCCPCRHHRQCCCHHALTLAFAVTIAVASANVTVSPTLLLMVGCCVVCCPLPDASSAIQICQPLSLCNHQRFCHRAAVPFCLPSLAAVLLLFYQASIAFAAPVDGWLLHSPPTQQHTSHINKLKTVPVSTLLDLF